jgi:hypothetical protein
VQTLNPLAVADVVLGTAGQRPRLAGIDEADVEAPGLEQLEKGDPVDAGRLQGDIGHAAGFQPVGEGLEVDREGAEAAHRLTVSVGRDSDPVLRRADVDAAGVGVEDNKGESGARLAPAVVGRGGHASALGKKARGRGSAEEESTLPNGTRRGLSPMRSPQAPEATLGNGYTAPENTRP